MAEAGDLIFQPSGRWHPFCDARDGPLRIIAPSGLERPFMRLDEPGGEYNPETLPALAAQYGGDVDVERTQEAIGRHSLVL